MSRYKVVVKEPFENCELIYPIQQRKVKELVDFLKENENVCSVIIFGSSVTDRCHIDSDVDIYVTLKRQEKIHRYFNFVFDLWTNFTADEYLKKEIYKKGVVVYQR